mmetsp:Transcript_24183/g.51283  ORF Transcript_24183/g.51283 Transcript_24183/m.51283 type:complete len:139 (-) Transcript_24183:45-461(-)
MRSVLAFSVAAIAMLHTSTAFTCPSTSIATYSSPQNAVVSSTLLAHQNDNNEVELVPSLKLVKETSSKKSSSSVRQRVQKAGLRAWERMDTLKAAGLYDNKDGLEPMQSGFKTNVGLLFAAFMFKWYRARFINKLARF